MTNPLTHLHALRAFEAVARKSSFTLAAQDLCVTQAAVSHQVRQIEEALGVRLFERAHRRVSLTEAGERVYATIAAAFRDIETTLHEVRRQGETRPTVTVQVTPSFGSRWLARRLHRFWSEHPEIDLRIYHALPHEQYDVRRVDLAIKWGHGHWGTLRAEVLLSCRLVPVCAPTYLRPDQPIVCAEDLLQYTLLHEDSYEDWLTWFRTAQVTKAIPLRGTLINDSNTLIEAALNRQGIALGRMPLVREELMSGALVSPVDLAIPCEGSYHLVYDPKVCEGEAFRCFRTFLLEEANAA